MMFSDPMRVRDMQWPGSWDFSCTPATQLLNEEFKTLWAVHLDSDADMELAPVVQKALARPAQLREGQELVEAPVHA